MKENGSYQAATLGYTLTIEAGGSLTIPFFIAGSDTSESSMRKTFDALKSSADKLLANKAERFRKIALQSSISIPDSGVQIMYDWLKYNVDWLIRSVPNQGTGLSAGLPDYPWWFGADATYALQGVLATGDHRLAKETILLLHKLSSQTNNDGRIIHEVSTNGSVYNPGNVNETAQFITLIYNYYAWTGDRALVEDVFPEIKKGLAWLMHEKDRDGDHFPNGSGMMEIPGLESDLEMIDVAAYTQQAMTSASRLAYALGDSSMGNEYDGVARDMAARINKDWWVSAENSFGDFRATPQDANPIIRSAIIRSDTLKKQAAVAVLKKKLAAVNTSSSRLQPFVVYSNWVVNTPMETGVADTSKARAALKTARSYENVYGAFVTGIDKTDEPDSMVLQSRKKIFSYTGAVMTLPTGVLSVSAARYGMSDLSMQYIRKLERSFSYALPGSMYEVSPDFGMVTQAWNIYGVAVPIVQFMFGIQPHAYSQMIEITPSLPYSWTQVSIKQVKVGSNELSLALESGTETLTYKIRQTLPDWTVSIDTRAGVKRVVVDGKEVAFETTVNNRLILSGNELEIVVSNRTAKP
jgi:glycogen debranching enzyme